VRTWYQASEDCNEYGEETVRIKGVYATSVGEDTPILTRLAQWKIVPKRAVDLGVELRDASASPWSSVNNCTEGLRSKDSKPKESYMPEDLSRLTKKEKRGILARIRSEAPVKAHGTLRRSSKVEAACENLIGQVKDLSGETISRGLAMRLLGGTETKIAGRWFRSSAYGELFAPSKTKTKSNLHARVEKLRILSAKLR